MRIIVPGIVEGAHFVDKERDGIADIVPVIRRKGRDGRNRKKKGGE